MRMTAEIKNDIERDRVRHEKFSTKFCALPQMTQCSIAVKFVDYFVRNEPNPRNRYISYVTSRVASEKLMEFDFNRKGKTEKRFGPLQIEEMYDYILRGLRKGLVPFHGTRQDYSSSSPGMRKLVPQWTGDDT